MVPAILLFPVAAFSAAQAPDAAGVAADQKLGEARISREAGPSASRRSMTSPQPSVLPSAGAAHQNLSERNPTVASTIRTATKVSPMLTVATAAAVGSKL